MISTVLAWLDGKVMSWLALMRIGRANRWLLGQFVGDETLRRIRREHW